jgi:hypothetical protein
MARERAHHKRASSQMPWFRSVLTGDNSFDLHYALATATSGELPHWKIRLSCLITGTFWFGKIL